MSRRRLLFLVNNYLAHLARAAGPGTAAPKGDRLGVAWLQLHYLAGYVGGC